MKIKSIFTLTAAVMLITSCGKKENDSSQQNASPLAGSWTVCDSDGFTSNKVSMEFGNDSRLELIYSSGGYTLKYPGKYSCDGSTVSIELDRIDSVEELKSISDLYKEDYWTDEILLDLVETQNEFIVSEPKEYLISSEEEKLITPVGKEHGFRKEAYKIIADSLSPITQYSYPQLKDNGYCVLCSDSSLNFNADNIAFDKITGMNFNYPLDGYTPEEGFTQNFNFNRAAHLFAIAFHDETIVNICVGESADSDIFGSSALWYFDEDGQTICITEDDEKPKSIRAIIDFYKSLN